MDLETPVSLSIYVVLGIVYGFLCWKLTPRQQATEYVTKLLANRLRLSLPEPGGLRALKNDMMPPIQSSYAVGCIAIFILLFAIIWYIRPRYVLTLIVISWVVRYLLNRREPRDLARYLPALRHGLEWRINMYSKIRKDDKVSLIARLLAELKVVEDEVRVRPVALPPTSVIRKLSPDEVMRHYAQAEIQSAAG